MNKQNLGVHTLLVVLFGIFFTLYSCQKDSKIQLVKSTKEPMAEFIPSSEDVIPLIKSFKASHRDYLNSMKAFSDMPLDKALWTLEATVNFDFSSIKDSIINFTYDTITVYIDSYYENDTLKLDGESMLEAYDDLFEFIFEQLSDSTNIRLIAGDLCVTDTTSSTTTLMLTSVTGLYSVGDLSINTTDYWYAANGLGKCGPYPGIEIGKDAADRIDQVLDWNGGMKYACSNGGTVFYTSITSVNIIDECTNGWCFWNGSSANECLDPTDMSYWVGVAESEIESERPIGKVFIDVVFMDDFWFGSSTWAHKIYPVRFGIINCTDPHE